MTSRRTGLGLGLAAMILAACSVSIRTEPAQGDECLLARIQGTLVRHPETGLGVARRNGTVMPVMWPFGYSARLELSQIVLIDEIGNIVAREGEEIEMGGGGDLVWRACASGLQVVGAPD